MTRQIDTALLKTFVAVAETGGMTRAAQMLNLTQAAVSQQIKRLEDHFQVQLFERDKRRVTLSPDGGRLLPFAQRMLEMNDQMWGKMTTPVFAGEINIGVPHDVVKAFMPPILKAFNRTWPDVSVKIHSRATAELLQMLENGEIDLTLTTESEVGKGGEMLLEDPLVWVGVPGGRAQVQRPLPVNFGHEKCMFRAAAVEALADAGIDWYPISDQSDMISIYAAIEADLAVTPLMASTIPDDLLIVPAEVGLPRLRNFYVNMYLAPANSSDIAEELARFIREQFQVRYARAA